jgi:hypothetical protein
MVGSFYIGLHHILYILHVYDYTLHIYLFTGVHMLSNYILKFHGLTNVPMRYAILFNV